MNPDALNQCPETDDLSAWYDGELHTQGDVVSAHVRECEDCSVTVNAYGRIDASIRAGARPASQLADRIKKRCRELPSNRAPLFWLSPSTTPALRYAAALAVVGIVAAVFTVSALRMPPGGGVAKTTAEDDPVMPGDTTPVPEQLVSSERVTLTEPQPSGAHVDPATLRNANTDGLPTRGTPARVRRHALGALVSHVWVADEAVLANVREEMERAHPKAEWLVTEGQTRFELVAPDKDIQGVVDYLESAGTALMSPAFPQPGRAEEAYFSGKRIRYGATFVPAD